jgi:uncharacterized HAD superfamily protein
MSVIAMDLDGVLADYTGTFCRYHNLLYGTHLETDMFRNYFYFHTLGCSESESVKRIQEFEASEYFQEIRPIAGSLDAIANLSAAHDLSIVTARPEKLRSATEAWVSTHFGSAFRNVQISDRSEETSAPRPKSAYCRSLGASVMIEDSAENAVECAAAGFPVILLDAPWNRNHDLPSSVTRVKSWEEIARRLS